MIMNLGTMFLVFVVMILMPVVLLCTKPCRNVHPKVKEKHKSCSTSLQGNAFVRFFLESCLDIAICASLNATYLRENDAEMLWDTSFHVINNISLICLSLTIVLLPIWVLVFYCRNFKKWQNDGFEEKYGAIFEGLRTDRRSSLGYPMIFILRRFALVLVVTVGRDHLFAQMSLMVCFSTAQVGYLATYKPSEEKLGERLDIFNEVTTVVLVDTICVFSAGNLSHFDFEADIFFLVCLIGNMCVHLFFLLRSIFYDA
mmetsp:Transcript_38853/g.50866  ORF Transcript_38853/g.50866 Transcript_38853/m.50866 type:complete len:257 (-) Transcript_38853:602-1372(-)